ncbi:TonB-dependent receptor [Cytophagaceae bacterium DM2B3-1]|uniref:TonB-dependent receptor n=1 Tax=Xanthocytophaga flava TaxID=3048013 RepID=A0ABT7CHJ6_9BACT|nr:TonB-dependent receptor [Xanthocytophaga flavus]MDJ1493195.1 TonB-dependent receptor [Xanthocytophaga flavus]
MQYLYQFVKRPLQRLFLGLLVLPLSYTYGQVVIKGKVTDDANQPMAGVAVFEKGSTNGTSTSGSGDYAITVSGEKAVLVFSFIGYNPEEITVGNRTQINANLVPDIKSLSEVVVVGYGTQRRAEVTGSVASVKSADITQTPVTNVAQGLQARVAGVQITQNSSAPGGNISVRVRGTNSINGTSEPLYVIDGIQISNGGGVNDVSPLSTISPNDIESVEVLKDASSTAIYGARGANGVVIITTKRGKAGATRFTYDGYYGVQNVTKKLDMLNAVEFARLENEIYKTNVYDNSESLGQGVDWQDLIFRQAPIQSHQLSVNGGNEKTQFLLSANYFNQEGVVLNSSFDRYSLRLNLDHTLNDRFKVGTSIFGSYSVNNRIRTGESSIDNPVVTNSMVGAALGAPPTLQPYRPDGTLFPFADQFNGRYREVVNPLGFANILDRSGTIRTLVNLYAEAQIVKGLTYRATFNVDLSDGARDYYSPIFIVAERDRNATTGFGGKYAERSTTLLHESILTYSKTIAQHHSLKVTGVLASQSNNYTNSTAEAFGFPNDVTLNEALGFAPPANRNTNSFRNRERLDSYMARINYGFKSKYFLDLTARYDGASKFGENNKYGFFPGISAGWRISEEGFMKTIPFVSDLKLRASYGSTGNAGAIGPYGSLALFNQSSGYSYNNQPPSVGIAPVRIPNKNLRWERSIQADIGLDIGLFNNRLNLVVDYYNKRTKDLLFVKNLPLSSGYGTYTGNFAEIENKGIELAADAHILDGDFSWNVNANITFNRNKLISLVDNQQEFIVNNYSIIQVGQPLGIFRTFLFDGIYQTGETVLPGSDSRVGGVKVKDLNNDGQITGADQAITGSANPNFIFGFSTNLKYKNFTLDAFFSGVQGNQVFNLARYSFENPLGQRNLLAGTANRWSPENPSNEYTNGFQGGRIPISNRFMEDGSYIRCKNLTLGYNFSKIKGISAARVYISANNLFTLTKYTGYDPEVNTFGNSNVQVGVDNGVYPLARSILGGVQLTF